MPREDDCGGSMKDLLLIRWPLALLFAAATAVCLVRAWHEGDFEWKSVYVLGSILSAGIALAYVDMAVTDTIAWRRRQP
jgi:hypothetical protein